MSDFTPATPDENLPRKERERLVRRADIVTAACNVFGEKGFDKATLDEIAERAEYGKGTLYNYFASKEVLIEASVQRLLDDFHAIARDVAAEDMTVRQCFTEYTLRSVAYYREHYAFCHLVMLEHFRRTTEGPEETKKKHQENNDYTLAPLAERIREGMESGELRPGDPHMLAHVFVGLLDHYYIQLARDQLPTNIEDVHRQVGTLISVFFDGIAVPKVGEREHNATS